MKSVKNSILISLLCLATLVHGQNKADSSLAKDNVMIPLPTINLNFGFNHLMSDILLSKEGPSPFLQFGYQLSITQRAAKFLNITLDLYTSTVFGEEQRNQTNLNFRTSIFSQHLNVEYNFYPLLKPDVTGRQLIRPYVGVGIGAIFFRSKGDLKDASGSEYQFWEDGFIYAEAEGSVTQSEATRLTRDFEYETDLRDANLDGLRKYPQTAFSLPINAGIRFQISKNIGVNAGFAYALNFSDMLDNVSESGSGDRLGLAGNDNHLYGSIGLSVFLGTTKPSSKPKKPEEELLAATETNEDSNSSLNETDSKNGKEESDVGPNELPSLDKIKERPVADIIDQAASATLASSQKVELSQNQSQRLIKSVEETQGNSQLVEQVLNEAKQLTGKATSIEKAKLANAIEVQTATLTGLKETSIDYKSQSPVAAADTDNSTLIESIDLRLGQLDVINKYVKNAKTSEDLVNVATSIKEINGASVAAIQEEIKIQEARITEQKVQAFEDKLSLFEFVNDSEDLTKEDSRALNSLRQKLTAEYEELTTAGSLNESQEKSFDEILSSGLEQASVANSDVNTNQTTSSATTEKENDNNSEEALISNQESSSNSETELNEQNTSNTQRGTDSKKTPSIAEIENIPPKKTGGFHWADLNKNGWISPDEVLHFIDLLFDGEPVRTVEDIQNLIDYYFDQE